jgi:hypothetical protein
MTTRQVMENLQVDVLGKRYNIKFEDDLLAVHECAGYANIFGNEIHIDSSVTPDDMVTVMVHEVVELIGRMNELGLEHKQVTILAQGISQFLKSNGPAIATSLASLEGVSLDEIAGQATEDTKK